MGYSHWRIRVWRKWDRGVQIGPLSCFLRRYDEGLYLLVICGRWSREVPVWLKMRRREVKDDHER